MDTGHEVCSFGTLLRAYRAERGLSQDDLAERAGLSMAAISALERGLTRWPYRDTVSRLASAMELAPAERTALAVAGQRPGRTKPGCYGSTNGAAGPAGSGPATAVG